MLKFLPIILFFYARWVCLLFFNFHPLFFKFTATKHSRIFKLDKRGKKCEGDL